MKYRFIQEITSAATRQHLPPHLLAALVHVESSYKPNAYRYEPQFWLRYLANNPRWRDRDPERIAASYGLTQMLYVTAVEEHGFTYVEPEYLFVPAINLDVGATHLASLLAWADNDMEKALAAYNGGKGAALAKPYKTEAYAMKVLARWKALEGGGTDG